MIASSCLASINLDWLSHPAVRTPLTIAYVAVLLLVAAYGLHRYWLVLLYYRTKRNLHRPGRRFEDLPRVTVQLPMFNEQHVAERIIDAACRLDYPRDRLQIQVIDDSTDVSATIARARVDEWADRGVDIHYLHRSDRRGFKAGALADAMNRVTGEYIAIFDADFVPRPNFLKRTIHHFVDPRVGMVQTRWDHLNRADSVLTRSQAVFLDGHFMIEHTARNRGDRWINFNGTAGVWRKQTIDDAGGWQADTLTEDVDLSYRAQLAGWRFVFLPRVTCPAELPPEINAFKSQQHRWTKGSIQVAKKLLPSLLRARIPLGVKIEAFFHLTNPVVYLLVTLMVLLLLPALYANIQPYDRGTIGAIVWGLTIFALATCSAGTFYVASQREQRRGWLASIVQIPFLMSIGVGIALNNARAVIEALVGHESPFIRTPKYNTSSRADSEFPDTPAPAASAATATGQVRRALTTIPTPSIKVWMSLLEIAMGLYVVACMWIGMQRQSTLISVPFLALFAAGYFYVGLSSLFHQWRSARVPAASPA